MATKEYESLIQGPQTQIKRSHLSMEERAEVRHINVTRQANTGSPYTGQFTSVYYLEGEERAAAKKFVEENRDILEQIDYTHPDTVQRSVSREIYDWILHFLGERELRKYRNVVYEQRRDEVEWVIDRKHFEQYPNRRYNAKSEAAVVRETSFEAIFHECGDVISESDLEANDAIEGGAHNVLEYYRVAGPFDCEPTSVDEEMAIVKQN